MFICSNIPTNELAKSEADTDPKLQLEQRVFYFFSFNWMKKTTAIYAVMDVAASTPGVAT